MLCVDQRKFALKVLRGRVDLFDEQHKTDSELDDSDDCAPHHGHVKLGSPQQPMTIEEVENSHSQMDRAFKDFRKKFSEYLRTVPGYMGSANILPRNFQACHLT